MMIDRDHLLRHIRAALKELEYLRGHLAEFQSGKAITMQHQVALCVSNLLGYGEDVDILFEAEREILRRS